MTNVTAWLRFGLSLVGMAAFLWLISAAADHVWPEAKWYLVVLFLALWLFVFARQFVGGVNQYRDATDAFVHRRLVPAELPPDFRSLGHDKTLQQVIDEFGQPSRKVELVTPATSLGKGVRFLAYEYELPYEAAVVVMPEPPSGPDSRIRAVYFRSRADDDEIFSPVRA
jgi:hypothetical protein